MSKPNCRRAAGPRIPMCWSKASHTNGTVTSLHGPTRAPRSKARRLSPCSSWRSKRALSATRTA
eukprot:11185859-Lingulodinium_polyedra.AAC.1